MNKDKFRRMFLAILGAIAVAGVLAVILKMMGISGGSTSGDEMIWWSIFFN